FVRVNDLTYASDGANQTAPYRLTVRRGPWIDMIEPPVIPAGRRSEVVIYGRNLGGKPSDYYVDGQRLESLSVEISAPQRGSSTGALIHTPTELACPKFIYRHELNGVVANPVCIALTKQPTLAEQEPNDKLKTAQTVTLPADIVGSFGTANDRDGFVFAAKRGEKIWIEAQSRVLRQPTDVALVVQQLTEKDGEWSARDLTTVDDVASPGGNFRLPLSEDDPATLFTVPQDGKFRVLLREQLGATAGAPPRFYRLRIKAPEPAFQVVGGPGVWLSANTSNNQQLQPRSCVVRPGAAEEITLFAYRREGHRDEILVEAKGLPPQLVAEPAIVGPNVLLSSFMLRAKPDAEPWRGVISLVARSTVNGKEIEQPVGMLEILWTSPRNNRTPNPTRVTSGELFVAIDDSVVYPGRLEAPAQLRVARGGKIKVPVKMNKRLDSFKANVTVSAIGSLNRVTKRTASVTPDGKEVELELDVLQDATPGRFTFFLRGESDVDFEPFADLLKRAQDDQKRIDQISRDLAKAYQQATSEKRTADRVLQQANTLVSTAKSQRQAAESAKTQAEQRAKQAADRAKQGDTDALRDQAATAAKLAATAAEAATEKRRALEQAEQKLRAAKKQQAEADSAVTASKKIADEAAQQKRTADSVAQQAARTSRKRKLSAPFHSSLITLEIASLPIKHKFATRELVFKPGGEQSLAIAIEREFAFGDEVTFSLRQPSGFNSVRMASGKIEKNKNETTLNFTCDKKAKPGEYEAGVTVRLRYNNRTISEDVPLKLVVSSE
ncbi:MAG: hypothetical protein QF805_14445, partial [Pirellulaceae bacterium]|nr:hypothetical protein [Pirellulaceae bacterium]